MNKPSNKPIKITSVIGLSVYIAWQLINGYNDGEVSEAVMRDILIAMAVFNVLFYMATMHPTLFALAKAFLIIIIDVARKRITEEEAMNRLQLLIQQAVAAWNSIFMQLKKKNKKVEGNG